MLIKCNLAEIVLVVPIPTLLLELIITLSFVPSAEPEITIDPNSPLIRLFGGIQPNLAPPQQTNTPAVQTKPTVDQSQNPLIELLKYYLLNQGTNGGFASQLLRP